MARIFRFNQTASYHLTMQAAQQAGLPVNMPQISQGIQALLAKLHEYGIGLSVDDASPYFQNLMQQYGNNGQGNNVRPIVPQAQPPQQPVYQQQPAPVFIAPQPPPFQQPQYAPQAQQPQFPQPQPGPWQQPVAAGAITSGQPLPELAPPPGARRPIPAMPQGITPLPPGPVPVQAQMPAGLGDNPQGMTESVLTPTILD